MKKNTNSIQKTIMRRVYYAFTIRIATHQVTKHLVVLSLLGYVLTRLVHVAAIYKYVSSVQVGELGSVLMRIAAHADWPTLLVLGLVIFTALSLRFKLVMPSVVTTRFA